MTPAELNEQKEKLRELEEISHSFAAVSARMADIPRADQRLYLGYGAFQCLFGFALLLLAAWFWISANSLDFVAAVLLAGVAFVPVYFGARKFFKLGRTHFKMRRISEKMKKIERRKAELEKRIIEQQ